MLCKRSMRKPVTRSCVWFFLVVFCELIAKFLIEMEGMTLAMQNGNLYLHLFFQRAVVFHQQLTRFAASNNKKAVCCPVQNDQ